MSEPTDDDLEALAAIKEGGAAAPSTASVLRPCTCPDGLPGYHLLRAWNLINLARLPTRPAATINPRELAELRAIPGLGGIGSEDFARYEQPAEVDLREVHRTLLQIVHCPRHGGRRLWIIRNAGEFLVHPLPGPRGRWWVSRVEKPIGPVVDAARRAAMLARDSVLAEGSPIPDELRRRLEGCSFSGEARRPRGSSEASRVGDVVEAKRILWFGCGATEICPICQTDQAVRHFRDFTFAARHEIRAAQIVGIKLGVRALVLPTKSAKKFVGHCDSVAMRVAIWGTERSWIVYVGPKDLVGEPIEDDESLWRQVFEPPVVRAFATPNGAGWDDKAVLARWDNHGDAKACRIHLPRVPTAAEFARATGLGGVPRKSPHTGEYPCSDSRGTLARKLRLRIRSRVAGFLGIPSPTPRPGSLAALDVRLHSVLLEIERSLGSAAWRRHRGGPPETFAVVKPHATAWRRGDPKGRVVHVLPHAVQVGRVFRRVTAAERSLPRRIGSHVIFAPEPEDLEECLRAAVLAAKTLIEEHAGRLELPMRWTLLRDILARSSFCSLGALEDGLRLAIADGKVGVAKGQVYRARQDPDDRSTEGADPEDLFSEGTTRADRSRRSL